MLSSLKIEHLLIPRRRADKTNVLLFTSEALEANPRNLLAERTAPEWSPIQDNGRLAAQQNNSTRKSSILGVGPPPPTHPRTPNRLLLKASNTLLLFTIASPTHGRCPCSQFLQVSTLVRLSRKRECTQHRALATRY